MKPLRVAGRIFDGFERSFAAQIEAYRQERPDANIEVTFFDLDELHPILLGKSDRAFDLAMCVTDWLPEVVARGRLLDLQPFLAESPPADWPEGWSTSMLTLQTLSEGFFGMPYHDGPVVLHVRRDLFDDPEHQATFARQFGRPLQVPRTWEEFREVARFFSRPQDRFWGAALAGYPDAHNNVYDFLLQFWARGGELFPDGLKSPAAVDALRYLRSLYDEGLASPDCLDLDSVACGEYYAAGHSAMMWNWSGFAAVAEAESSAIRGKNECHPMPAGPTGRSVSLNIYWVLGILGDCDQPRAAYDFLRFLAQPEMDRQTTWSGGNGVRLSTWRDPQVRARYPYYSILEQVHQNVKSPPAIPQFSEMAALLNHMVDRVVRHGADPEAELLSTQIGVNRLF